MALKRIGISSIVLQLVRFELGTISVWHRNRARSGLRSCDNTNNAGLFRRNALTKTACSEFRGPGTRNEDQPGAHAGTAPRNGG